jgi:hypothetical protein
VWKLKFRFDFKFEAKSKIHKNFESRIDIENRDLHKNHIEIESNLQERKLQKKQDETVNCPGVNLGVMTMVTTMMLMWMM